MQPHITPVNAETELEVVAKPHIRSKGKAQTDRESAAYVLVCEHLSEACNAAMGPQMGFCNHF